ncbi:MAG: DNA polymerase Y family protein [Phycisphaeraceae bacterium]
MSLFLPHWPIDRLRRRRGSATPDAVRLLVQFERGRQVVAARCLRAAERGVEPGMTLAHARALLGRGAVEVTPFEPERDAAGLEALARWTLRFAPIAAADPPDGLLLDVTGCERLYGSEKRLLEHVMRAVETLGLTVRAAVAPTTHCARALARFAPEGRLLIGETDLPRAVEPLPVSALDLDAEVEAALVEVGLDRIEQVLTLPREQLVLRFGEELLHRLDGLLGFADEPIDSVREQVCPRAERVFAGPVRQWEAVEQATRLLLGELAGELEQRGSGAVRLRMTFDPSEPEAGVHRESLHLSGPCRDVGHLWSLVRPRLERVDLGPGIERIELMALGTRPMPPAQTGWWQQEDARVDEPAIAQMVDQIQSRLGEASVLRPRLRDTHVPEAACTWEPVTHARSAAPVRPAHPPLPGSRPSVLLDPPESAEVTLLQPEGPILTLRWRGESRRIRAAIGPEQITGRWWLGHDPARPPPARDYYRVQDEQGRWLWLYRDGRRRWFVHGLWG